MSKINSMESDVKYPEKEKAYAVIPEDKRPFSRATVGITYPQADYNIFRQAGNGVNNFEFVLEGEGEIFLGGKWQRVTAGEMYIMRGGDEHKYRALPSDPWKKIWITYSAGYISSFMDAYGIETGIYHCEGAKNYFETAFDAVRLGSTGAALGNTIADCMHKIISLAAASLADYRDGESPAAYKIRRELGDALYKKLDLGCLADKLYMSKSNVIRVFKKSYGVTPYEYLLSLKIEAAKALLLGTQMSVKEIADRLCISDEHYFSTLFYKRVGSRPVEFRKR